MKRAPGEAARATSRPPMYPIESVESVLRLIKLFKDRSTITVSDAAAELGVARSTAHRLLAMLLAHGFVRQEHDRGPYTVGMALFDVGARAFTALDIRLIARPFVQRLSQEVNETASFGVRFDDRIVFVETFEGRESLRVSNAPGQQFSAHDSAIGRALLALLPNEEVRTIYPREKLPQTDPRLAPPNLFTTRSALLRELYQVRERGYAVNFDAPAAGICAIGCAVLDGRGKPLGGISVAAPISRVRKSDIPALAAIVVRTAREFHAALPPP